MSYCRWSCLNGYSDVYVYEDVSGGWTTHVASHRQPPGAPYHSLDLILTSDTTLYEECHKAWQKWRKDSEYTEIELEESGNTYNHDSPGECAEFLQGLNDKGFVVPYWAIQELRHEQEEMDNESVEDS